MMISQNHAVRVLHVVFGMNRGGMESRLMDLYRNIDRERVVFDFLENTAADCAYNNEIRSLGGKIYRSGYSRKSVRKAARYVDRFFKDHPEYRIVHIHESYLPSFNMIVLHYAKRDGRRKIILHSRNASGSHVILHQMLKNSHSQKADYHFACSKLAAAWMFDKNTIQKGSYTVINNAIDAKKFCFDPEVREKIRSELGIKKQEIVIGHAGRFYEQKNHKFLIKIMAELKNRKNRKGRFRLVLAGDGPLKQQICQKAADLGLKECITFLGVRKDMERIYQAFDIFILPSLFEGLPGVGVEAQAAGLPCLFSDTITEEIVIIPNLAERLTIKKGPSVWADRILELADKKCPRRNTYAELARAGYDVCGIAQRLAEFYEEVDESCTDH